MPFYLHITTAAGSKTRLDTRFSSINQAMTVACAALRHGAREAWVEDQVGKVMANFEDIQKHCEGKSSLS
jgi:hypothetical protein